MSKMPKVIKTANLIDRSTGDASELFRYSKVGGGYGEVAIFRDEARNLNKVRDLLIRKNADLPYSAKEANEIVKVAIRSVHTERRAYARHVGWQGRGRTHFVTARGVIGPKTQIRLLPPLWASGPIDVRFGRAGSVKGWKKGVARRCGYSSCGMLTLSAALAAPLLTSAGLQSFGFNLFGPSKAGKTALLLAASSVVGIGRESGLPNLAATGSAALENAQLLNDNVFTINEAGLLAGSKKAAYAPLREMVYRLSEGRDRQRHTSWTNQNTGQSREFRNIFITTAERSFEEYARLAQDTRDEGEYARCVDVPAAQGRHTVIDRLPKRIAEAEPAKQREWERRQVSALRRACEDHHGKVLRPYIEFLIGKGQELDSLIAHHMAEFMKVAQKRKVEGALEHASRNFALIYAGGRLGIESGLLPWKPKRLMRSIVKCFDEALSAIQERQFEQPAVESVLVERLKSADVVNLRPGVKFGPDKHEGFWRKVDGKMLYTIHAKAFRGWFANDHLRVQEAVAWLDSEKLLKPKNSLSAAGASGADWFEQSPKWPNGKSVRSIVFFGPADPDEKVPE